MNNMCLRTPEILAPAGDLERLEAAVRYGADAVYLGGDAFGMRAACPNFDETRLPDAVAYAHARGVPVYLVCNTLPSNEQADALPDFLQRARDAKVDALIVADVGVMMLAKRLVPEIPLHVSTQAGIVNYLTATELHHMGAARVVLARELTLDEIRRVRDHTPPELELEAFVHGAMCMSFSGRCLLSHYMTGRDANQGACAQPCRWSYSLVEEKRPGQYFPIVQDEGGSYILNANDLCMAQHIDKLVAAGIDSFKIEGRAKSAYYTAVVTNAYRGAMDAWKENPDGFVVPSWVMQELEKVSHRPYSTGFFMGMPDQNLSSNGYIREWDLIAVVEDWQDGMLTVCERNRFAKGDLAEIMLPFEKPMQLLVERIIDLEEGEVEVARHPMRRYQIPCASPVPAGAMLRRAVQD